LTFARTEEALQLKSGARELLRYQLKKPSKGGPSVESACYIHPLSTPSGTIVTDVGPQDHRHHRGVFLGWVEMHGARDADFWGWGEPAPTARRQIVNRLVEAPPPVLGFPKFRVVNEWRAEGLRLLTEDLRIAVSVREKLTTLDVAVQLTPDAEITLARWAFGGFALRTRKDGEVLPIGPEGAVKRAPAKHTDPASNWPDVHWYGLHLKLSGGREATVAIANRKANPPTTWHVVPGIGLLNPCITAPAMVRILPDKPLVLRYRIIAADGPPDYPTLKALGEEWYQG
jgi:hypothetical protein